MKDDRVIHKGVFVGGKTYTDPDELEQFATPEQLQRLAEQGDISGNWGLKPAKPADDKKKVK